MQVTICRGFASRGDAEAREDSLQRANEGVLDSEGGVADGRQARRRCLGSILVPDVCRGEHGQTGQMGHRGQLPRMIGRIRKDQSNRDVLRVDQAARAICIHRGRAAGRHHSMAARMLPCRLRGSQTGGRRHRDP